MENPVVREVTRERQQCPFTFQQLLTKPTRLDQ